MDRLWRACPRHFDTPGPCPFTGWRDSRSCARSRSRRPRSSSRDSTPPGHGSSRRRVAGLDAAWTGLVEPHLGEVSRPMRHYLGARVFANWVAYQGRGLRTVVAWLRTCLAVLNNEIARRVLASRQRVTVDDVVAAAR